MTLLEQAIRETLGPDPHSGGAPHPETVAMLVNAMAAMCRLSNARPYAYRDEPWREQSAEYHAQHAADHAERALLATLGQCEWLSDLGQPEVAHAMMRLAFVMYQMKRGM